MAALLLSYLKCIVISLVQYPLSIDDILCFLVDLVLLNHTNKLYTS